MTIFATPKQVENAKVAPVQLGWQADMISPLSDVGVGGPASILSKQFNLQELPQSAVLRISALGLYRVFINGQRVGEDLLTPGWTNYDQRLAYQTYSVENLFETGDNHIEIMLGDGWLRSPLMWEGARQDCVWGDRLGAIAEISTTDDVDPILVTDTSWSSAESKVRKSGIYFGEIFDASFKANATYSVDVIPFDISVLLEQECQPVRELSPLCVVTSWRDDAGRTIYDFGQNIGGYISFEVEGDKGASICVEHAEILDQSGAFYNVNYRTAEAQIEYVLGGNGVETYRPYFTFQGFRFARVTLKGNVDLRSIEAVPISSVAQEPATSFKCSSPLVNQLVENTIWSQRGNFIDIPSDCPQRDERLGWTGDAQVFAGTACYLADCHGFLSKFVHEMIADQEADGSIAHVSPNPFRLKPSEQFSNMSGSTGWGDAISVIPYTLWLHYNDQSILEKAFPAMTRWNEFVWSISDGPIVRPPPEWGGRGFTFGDWLQPMNDDLKAVPTMGDDAAATIYLYISSAQIAVIARVLGKVDDAQFFEERAALVKAAFQKEFITSTGRLVYDDQTSYALAILHDLIPSHQTDAAAAYFLATIKRAHGRIGTGFIGTPALLPVLVKIGEVELAADVFLQEEVPGWLYQIKMGATTIWERWDGIKADGSIYEPAMNSYNHYAYGAVCQWMFESLAGYRPDPAQPGFENVIFEPVIIPRLSPVEAHHASTAGSVEASWSITDDIVTYQVASPCGGTLVMSHLYQDILVDGTRLETSSGEEARSQLAPGKHVVTFRIGRQIS